MSPSSLLSIAERRREAAARLCHDLGKSVRWLAPAVTESSVAALRERLESDLVRTRRGPSGAVGAVEIFDAWRQETGSLFEFAPALGLHVTAIAQAIEAMRAALPRLADLEASDLSVLDDASRVVARESRALRDAAAVGARSRER
ncbi:MAG: hypothetical protein ABI968_07780 [Acidobacteriota bacterium]